MIIKKVFALALLISCFSNLEAQYHNLLNLTEKQLQEKLTDFPIVSRDSSEHEFVPYLTFRNKENKVQLVISFFANKCYLIKHYTLPKSLDSIVNRANLEFNRIGENRWRSKTNTFEVFITATPNQVVTMYSRGVSTY
jgi:hypothetical protein